MGGGERGNGMPPAPDDRPTGGGPLWLHPDDDLAPNRPGEILYGRVAALPAGRVRLALDRLLGRAAARDALLAELRGEELVGARLDDLAGAGWRVLHSIPLPGAATIPHLAIGPAGVLGLRPVLHHGARLTVDEEEVRTDGGRAEPHVRRCRRDARRAAHALSLAAGFRVPVRPVLVPVAAAAVSVAAGLRDVEVLPDAALDGLARLGGALAPDAVEILYGLARDRRTWLHG
ncbi:nuclease-related domain-containing protein [Streptomyces hainanensis]|uniref:NERD domain-containing protein n=1 Tax=Streptomyces hainanensis TaxID=402648 RepID=A0A4R4TFF1_9ACTN|nr:nuclease-related domain-containing protein [Streptomyces hainanensis]TDC74344.1 NERD domain-containing protein [Streptomyces hainanensis]